ncbi:Carbonic anhydrase 1 [Bremerella volcania]|uniref:Carbonic anhydrase n=1 Tax=Bremerella volcania TaxID=2527984 RepID=A0A518CAQ3_9BACT|nr:carbonic anhydrase [Bremerella volcania]QDU76303.1 Carbonic anhydrase 1 [Bremerella volcania]
MRDLLTGVTQFQKNTFPKKKSRFEELGRGQSPEALFITCSDSRVNPELFTNCEPGEIFVIRNAGNIVGRKGEADLGMAATIEYAVKALRVPQIIVCGHAKCGAMQGLMTPEAVTSMPEVGKWVSLSKKALEDLSVNPHVDRLTQIVEANIRLQLRNLMTFPEVADAVEAGSLRLHGWLYDFETGKVTVLAPEINRFVDCNVRIA